MPLQKLPPNGPMSVSAPVGQRPQLQNRRRTLQTISELSATDGGLPNFVSSIGIENSRRGHDNIPGVGRTTSRLAEQQSLPQYHPSPNVHSARPTRTGPPAHAHEAYRSQSMQGCRPIPIAIEQVDGWNAKRERARIRQESAFAEARAQQSMPHQAARITTIAGRPDLEERPKSVRVSASQQKPLKSSESGSSLFGHVEQRASLMSTNTASQYDTRSEAPERASTDSSSYQSRDSAVNRARSCSSNTSYTSQDAPPLPNGTSADMSGYCAELILQNQNLVSFGESARSKNLNPHRSSRPLSVHTVGVKHTSTPQHRYATAPDLRQLSKQQPRQISAQRARNQALAALTAVNSHSRTNPNIQHSTFAYSSPHQNRHASLTSHPPNGTTNRKSASPHRNSLRYQAQFEAQRRTTSPAPVYHNNMKHNSLHRQSDSSRRVSFEQRTVPKRESLTQWKQEREAAKANTYTDHKAMMQERVRRANELEEEREKELVSMGKRSSKTESRSCFGGLFTVMRGKSG